MSIYLLLIMLEKLPSRDTGFFIKMFGNFKLLCYNYHII